MANEFSFPVSRTALAKDGQSWQLEAGPAERQSLTERFNLAALDELKARLVLEHVNNRGLMRLSGELEARYAESCVVTLAAIPRELRTPVDLLLTSAPSAQTASQEVTIDVESEDPPEAVGAEGLDLGELLVQLFASHLEPFPRAPEARLEQSGWGQTNGDTPPAEGPFAALRNWRR
ncbi:MAG: hypothetical protein AAF495_00165 [Pseudomonadota bacterium]